MVIIGIESSCDETGVGVLKNKKLVSNIVASQEDIHSRFGGVVPELASRAHLEKIDILFRTAIEKSDIGIDDIDYIGVTSNPGLKGSLIVGVSFACGLSYSLGIPVYKIDHLKAHLAANYLNSKIDFPALGLVVSGGHTTFFYLKNHIDFNVIGRTLDDACGEAFDKVARMLGLPFPGGPEIEKQAKMGDENKIKFPVVLLSKNSLDFSFSGIKTAVMYYIREHGKRNISDICASFQKAVADTICIKIERALKKYKVKSFLSGGGVVQNEYLRNRIKETIGENVKLFIPEKKLCLDNGGMVAILTSFLIKYGVKPSENKIEVIPTK